MQLEISSESGHREVSAATFAKPKHSGDFLFSGMKEIRLHGMYGVGKVTLVDDEDFERLSFYKWRLERHQSTKARKPSFTVVRSYWSEDKKCVNVYMHWEILGKPPKGLLIDHANRNTLDNRKQNLRVATRGGNAQNAVHQLGASGYRGVMANNKKFEARIKANGIRLQIGTWANAEDAARAYDEKAKELHGEFAILNFPL